MRVPKQQQANRKKQIQIAQKEARFINIKKISNLIYKYRAHQHKRKREIKSTRARASIATYWEMHCLQ